MSKERELLKKMYDQFATVFPSEEEQILLDEVEEILAQPEPEPEAWMLIDKETGARIPRAYKPEREVNKDRWKLYPLYAVPPNRKPLSDDEIILLGVQNLCNEANAFKPFGFARAIEKAHGIGVSDE